MLYLEEIKYRSYIRKIYFVQVFENVFYLKFKIAETYGAAGILIYDDPQSSASNPDLIYPNGIFCYYLFCLLSLLYFRIVIVKYFFANKR